MNTVTKNLAKILRIAALIIITGAATSCTTMPRPATETVGMYDDNPMPGLRIFEVWWGHDGGSTQPEIPADVDIDSHTLVDARVD